MSDSESESALAPAYTPAPRRPQAPNNTARGGPRRISSENNVPERPERTRKPSVKTATTEKENFDAAQQRFLAAQKTLENAKKKLNKLKPATNTDVADEEANDCESEERDDDETTGFPTSITPLGRLPLPPAPTAVSVRKTTQSQSVRQQRIRANAFKNLPEISSDQRGDDADNDPPSPGGSSGDGAGMGRRSASSPSAQGEKRGRLTTAAATAATAAAAATTTASSDSVNPPAKRAKTKIKVRESKFRDGFLQAPGAKPKAADYEPLVEALIIRACAEYSARILTINAFPSTSLQLQWAKECWDNAGYSADDTEKKRGPRYLLTDRIAKLITKRGSQIRGKIVESFRPLFASHYKLQRSVVKATIAANKVKVEELLEDSVFHYKDIKSYTGYGENPIIAAARNQQIFRSKTSLAAIFRTMFNPVPASYVALDFAVLEHLTREWETGVPADKAFTEKDNVESYRRYLIDVNEWCDDNPEVTTKIRARWYKRATQTFGVDAAAVPSNVSAARREANRAELEGRTGDTDSEGAVEEEEDPFGPDDMMPAPAS